MLPTTMQAALNIERKTKLLQMSQAHMKIDNLQIKKLNSVLFYYLLHISPTVSLNMPSPLALSVRRRSPSVNVPIR